MKRISGYAVPILACTVSTIACSVGGEKHTSTDSVELVDSAHSESTDCSSYDHKACGDDGNVYEYAPEGCDLAPLLVERCVNEECEETSSGDAYCCGPADTAYCSSDTEVCMRDSCGNSDASSCETCGGETSCLDGECLSDCSLSLSLDSSSCSDVDAVWYRLVGEDDATQCRLGDLPAYVDHNYTYAVPLGETWYMSVRMEAWPEGSIFIEECFGEFECEGEDLSYSYRCEGL